MCCKIIEKKNLKVSSLSHEGKCRPFTLKPSTVNWLSERNLVLVWSADATT
jgi:hypothetical protein